MYTYIWPVDVYSSLFSAFSFKRRYLLLSGKTNGVESPARRIVRRKEVSFMIDCDDVTVGLTVELDKPMQTDGGAF